MIDSVLKLSGVFSSSVFVLLPVNVLSPVGLHGVILVPYLARLNLQVQVAFFNTMNMIVVLVGKFWESAH